MRRLIPFFLICLLQSWLIPNVVGQTKKPSSPKPSAPAQAKPPAATPPGATPPKSTPAKPVVPKNILVFTAEDKAYSQLAVSDKGVVATSIIPDTVFVIFTGVEFTAYSIQINQGKNAVKLSFDYSDTTAVHLDPRDMRDYHDGQEVALVLQNGALTGVWDRSLPGKSHLVDNPPYIQIVDNSSHAKAKQKAGSTDDTYKALSGDSPQVVLALDNPPTPNDFYCSRFSCPNCDNRSPFHALDSKDNGAKSAATNQIPSFYTQHLMTANDPSQPNAITPKYKILYDDRDSISKGQSRVTFLKLKREKSYEYYKVKKSISPLAFHEIEVDVLGKSDSTYQVDTTAQNYYDNSGADISSVLASLAASQAPDNTQAPGSTKTNPPVAPKDTHLPAVRNAQTTQGVADSINQADNPDMMAFADLVSDTALRNNVKIMLSRYANKAITLKIADSTVSELQAQIQKDNLLIQKNAANAAALQKENTGLQRQIDSFQILIDTLRNQNAALRQELAKVPKMLWLKEQLMGFEEALEMFNHDYAHTDGREKQYQQDLLCMMLTAKNTFDIPVPRNGASLARLLVNLAGPIVDKQYRTDFKNIIQQIEDLFDTAITRKPEYHLFVFQEPVPNDDVFSIKIKSAHASKYLMARDFMVSGGLKIDFSTGIFFNAIGNDNFILGTHHFLFRPTRDSVNPATGAIDTIFNGDVKDTAGNLIQRNHNAYGYGAGFLAHIYYRSGQLVNYGIATGLTITNNNNSPINVMLGLSVMFGTGSSRISLVAGLVMGQQKALSAEASRFVWNSKTQVDNHLYPTLQQMPQFYTGSNDIPTYERWVHSWFFGISYNFASLKLNSSKSN